MHKSPARSEQKAQNNTLLNYFQRTPKQKSHSQSDGPSDDDGDGDNQTPRKALKTQNTNHSADRLANAFQSFAEKHNVYDLVWAKIPGYPWWPSIVCNDPDLNRHENRGRIHVQFFDEQTSHAWIMKRDIKPFVESSLPKQSSSNARLKSAIEEARLALDMDLDERSKLIGPLNSGVCPAQDNQEIVTPSKRKNRPIIKDNDDDDDDDDENVIGRKQIKKFKRIAIESDSDNEEEKDEYHPDTDIDESYDDLSDLDLSGLEDVEEEEDEETPKKPAKKIKSKNSKNKTKDKVDDFIMDQSGDCDDSTPAKKYQSKAIEDDDGDGNIEISEPENVDFNLVKIDPSIYDNDDNDSETKTSNTALEYAVVKDRNLVAKKVATSTVKNVEKATASEQASTTEWPHLTYKFLKQQNIKDLNGNKMLIDGKLNPKYDPTTLYVPMDFLQSQTPAVRQWWELKSKHFDTILFFKMGKFYEFFHMDAVICAKELKILFMRGDHAHAGFPEKSYKQYADALIQKGYKVARVEQTETPEMMMERCKKMSKATKFDRVVKREICRISSVGTRLSSDIDADTFLDYNSYLMAFVCKPNTETSMFEFGACFVDVSLGKFFLTQFQDDRYHSKLRTLIAHHIPSEIILENSDELAKLFQAICPSVRVQQRKRFWSAQKTLKFIYEKDLWSNVPEDFKKTILDVSDVIQQTPRPEFELAIISLGAIIECLNQCLILDDIITMGQFEIYRTPGNNNDGSGKLPENMILDSMTIKNLEIFESLNDFKNNDEQSSLFKIIDNCATNFGKRLLRNWVCQPLCGKRKELEQRKEAVQELAEDDQLNSMMKNCHEKMKKIPDLDRLLTQIHSQSLKRSMDHPDSRAILFETETYQSRRILKFLDVLDGFEKLEQLIEEMPLLSRWRIKSIYLRQLVQFPEQKGLFPRLADKIQYFYDSFDSDAIRIGNRFTPKQGFDEDYDRTCEKIDEILANLDKYRKKQEEFFRIRINYVHVNKDRYALELPDNCDPKVAKHPEELEIISTRKGFKRYHSPTLLKMIAELERTEYEREAILGDISRKIMAKFDSDHNVWCQAIECMAKLDALMSLANTRQVFESNGSVSCMPTFLWAQEKPVIHVTKLRNAFLVPKQSIIPNDIELQGQTLILTGPNMGGKTTLMRSVGLMTILAQIGAYVPAYECYLTPMDRIFTRIGSYDIVLENESTFKVELNEALTIVRYATCNSLALIDELGSGTSTFDGTAIASAIISELTDKIKCCTLFSTHYHSILGDLEDKPNVKLGFMSFMIENENDEDPTEENVIFLYELRPGICNKSYGFNVAKLAGIPMQVIRRAYKHAKLFEMECQIKSLLHWFQTRREDCSNIKTIKDNEEMKINARKLLMYLEDLKKLQENNPELIENE